MKKKFKDLIKTPSEALQHMVDGLIAASKRDDFLISMVTFGETDKISTGKKVCFGCAATCTIQHITGIDFTPDQDIYYDNQRARILKMDDLDLSEFESCIDSARLGSLIPLFTYFDLREKWKKEFNYLFNLNSQNWNRLLPKVENLIIVLKQQGL